MGRPPCCDKSNVKRGLWTAEEDAKILAYVSNHGIGNWTLVPKKAGLNRCGKSCRLRWTNYLRPDLKHDSFTPQEEDLIINLHEAVGSRWSFIAKRLPGRTDNDVKNHWNTKLRKKLTKMGIDPVTHKPVSQVLSDLGSITSLPNLTITTEPSSNTQQEDQPRHHHHIKFLPSNNNNNNNVHQVPNNNNNEAASSCSSSSSSFSSPHQATITTTTTTTTTTTPCSSFDWSEFLLCEPFICTEFQYEMQGVLPSSVIMHQDAQNSSVINNNEHHIECQISNMQCCEGTSSSSSSSSSCSSGVSFVDAILDRDSEIRAAFPQLLDGSFDY